MVALRHRWKRKDQVARYLEEIDDFHGHSDGLGRHRSAGLVRRLAKMGKAHLLPAGLDLEGEWFVGEDLTGACLRRANLRGAELAGANLGRANLKGAKLEAAKLSDANLEGADLGGASLKGACLGGAKLRGAYLNFADLRGVADLTEEQLRSGIDWESAYRDQSHAYGESIPERLDD